MSNRNDKFAKNFFEGSNLLGFGAVSPLFAGALWLFWISDFTNLVAGVVFKIVVFKLWSDVFELSFHVFGDLCR